MSAGTPARTSRPPPDAQLNAPSLRHEPLHSPSWLLPVHTLGQSWQSTSHQHVCLETLNTERTHVWRPGEASQCVWAIEGIEGDVPARKLASAS